MTKADTKVLSMRLHEKLSGNQHASSLKQPHLEAWDLHVGARLNVLGRPLTTLMQLNLLTQTWLEYHASPPDITAWSSRWASSSAVR